MSIRLGSWCFLLFVCGCAQPDLSPSLADRVNEKGNTPRVVSLEALKNSPNYYDGRVLEVSAKLYLDEGYSVLSPVSSETENIPGDVWVFPNSEAVASKMSSLAGKAVTLNGKFDADGRGNLGAGIGVLYIDSVEEY